MYVWIQEKEANRVERELMKKLATEERNEIRKRREKMLEHQRKQTEKRMRESDARVRVD